MFGWISDYWEILIWAVPVLVGCAVLRYFIGWKLSLPAFISGLAFIIFLLGRKIERDNYKNKVQDIQKKRDEAYEKINSRDTTADDVLDRLHDGSF